MVTKMLSDKNTFTFAVNKPFIPDESKKDQRINDKYQIQISLLLSFSLGVNWP